MFDALDPGWAALIGAVVGGAATLIGTLLANWQSRRNARQDHAALVAATALLMQDDFLHYQATLARTLDRCHWWQDAELLPTQATIDDRKTVWAALSDANTITVADAQGWMDYLIQRHDLVGAHLPIADPDLETVKMTFRKLADGRQALAKKARRTYTGFEHSHVLETLEHCHTVDQLLN